MQPLNLPKESQRALLKGSNIFITPITNLHSCDNFDMEEDRNLKSCKGCYPLENLPFTIGQELFLQEDFLVYGFDSLIEYDPCEYEDTIQDKSIMTEEQSRFKCRVVKIEEILIRKINVITMLILTQHSLYEFQEKGWRIFTDWCSLQGINYLENPKMYLYTIERI